MVKMVNTRSIPHAVFCVSCLAVALFKLWLASGEEIAARFQPLDDLWQMLAAAHTYWFPTTYDWTTYVRPPIYPLWVAGVNLIGVPLRIATEILYLASALIFVLSLAQAKVPRIVAFIVYLFIALHPATFSLFNYSLPDTLYSPLLLLTLAALLSMWVRRHERNLGGHAILAGIVLALLWNVRPETVLLSGLLFLFFLLAGAILAKETGGMRAATRPLAIMLLTPCAIIFLSTLALKTANYLAFGLFTSTEISAPGFTAASKALLRIKPEKSERFIPVTKQARAVAYAASPAFRELQPFLESPNFGMLETERSLGLQGEIAAGWFYWVLRQSAAAAGHGQSPVAMDAYFQKIADELNAAFASGRLSSRLVWSDLLDPDPANYAPYLMESLVRISRIFTTVPGVHEVNEDTVDESTRRIFDVMANRRTSLLTHSPTEISGWVFGEKSVVETLSLRGSSGTVLATTANFSARPDVAAGFSAPANTGFLLKTTANPQQVDGASLVADIGGGREIVIPLAQIPIGQAQQKAGDGGSVTMAIDSVNRHESNHTAATGIQRVLAQIYSEALIFLGYMGLIAIIVVAICFRSIDLADGRYMILWLGGAALALRVALITIIDASSWPGNQVRYLFPVMQIYGGLLVLLVYTALHLLRTRYSMSRRHARS